MSVNPERMSLQLFRVLESVGISEDMRKFHRDICITWEIMQTIYSNSAWGHAQSFYIFGSTCEGTKTPGMASDYDTLVCHEAIMVIKDIRDAPATGKAYLMMTSEHTKPGYVKLQAVLDGMPLTEHNHTIDDPDERYDCEGRVCYIMHLILGDELFYERNGPAQTDPRKGQKPAWDIVSALRCKTFPLKTEDALQKCIACGLVSTDEVKMMKKQGILLVRVGHEFSPEKDIENRISFSLQERHLMQALNPTQHKCYVNLKIIKNMIIAEGDVKESLTSYHCKTCLLTVITRTDKEMWTEENLIKCTFICLTELKEWVKVGYCPNFFISDNNMFERKEFRQAQNCLLDCIQKKLDEGPSLFLRIESDHIGCTMQGLTIGQHDYDFYRSTTMYGALWQICEIIWKFQNDILKECHKRQSSQQVKEYLFQKLHYVSSIDTITEHTQDQTRMVVRLLEPIHHKLIAQQLASEAFSTEDPISRQQLLETYNHHLAPGMKCDALSCRLLETTVLYKMGKLGSCCLLLEQIEQNMHEAIEPLCSCFKYVSDLRDNVLRYISTGVINQHNIMQSSVAMCITFLSSQSEIIPKALQYEIYRSGGVSPEAIQGDVRSPIFDKWFDINKIKSPTPLTVQMKNMWCDRAVVDSEVYLYFLQYLVYSDLKKELEKIGAIVKLSKALWSGYQGHRETGYNLLGWIGIQTGDFDAAAKALRISLRTQPDINAAKWHLGVLLWHLSRQQV